MPVFLAEIGDADAIAAGDAIQAIGSRCSNVAIQPASVQGSGKRTATGTPKSVDFGFG
jgi:hypothetical protein